MNKRQKAFQAFACSMAFVLGMAAAAHGGTIPQPASMPTLVAASSHAATPAPTPSYLLENILGFILTLLSCGILALVAYGFIQGLAVPLADEGEALPAGRLKGKKNI